MDEVAIFRVKLYSSSHPSQNRGFDQIYWTNGSETYVDVTMAPLSFYLGYPNSANNTKEDQFLDLWHLRAGGFEYDVKEYTFISSEWTSRSENSFGKLVFTKNNVLNIEDLLFEFEMFVVSLAEARKIHPQPSGKNEEGAISWRAAYTIEIGKNRASQTE